MIFIRFEFDNPGPTKSCTKPNKLSYFAIGRYEIYTTPKCIGLTDSNRIFCMTIKFHTGKLILSRDNKVAILLTLNNFISLKKKKNNKNNR